MRCEECIHEKVCEGYSNCEEVGLCEPKRPHGEWKLVQRGIYVDIVCPFCGYVREDSIVYGYTTDQVIYSIKQGVFGYDFPNFCEECGAKMELEEGENNGKAD